MHRAVYLLLVAVALGPVFGVAPIFARNVDLSTVPKRDSVQLTIYNSEDLTLVRETRTVTFKKGVNPLQFSWANTLIDPTSVELKFLTSVDKLDVLDTTYPHDKPQMLYWNVQSEIDGEATIQITYFTSGITWSADYLLIADKDEKQLSFDGFVRVFNNSGEEYEDAQVRLVVGTINLVEKIAQLAHLPQTALGALEPAQRDELGKKALHAVMDLPAGTSASTAAPAPPLEEKQIIKEGLSEYFIYTIDGTETIQNGWSKRMRSLDAAAVPFKIQYRYRPQEYGEQLVRMYLLTNNKDSKLGTSPLPDGVVRVFRDNGRDGLSYLTQQSVKYIPIGDKIELNLGSDPEVIFEWIKLKTHRSDIWFQVNGMNVFHKLDEQGFRGAEHVGRRLGRPRGLQPASPQLHGQADRARDSSHSARARRVSQPARSEAARLSDGRVQNNCGGGEVGGSPARDRPPPRAKRQAEQRDAGSRQSRTLNRCNFRLRPTDFWPPRIGGIFHALLELRPQP